MDTAFSAHVVVDEQAFDAGIGFSPLLPIFCSKGCDLILSY